MKKTLGLTLIVCIAVTFTSWGAKALNCPGGGDHHPIVFVHGGAGSADQFESQALRFASNGYSPEYITGFDYDSSMANNTVDEIMAALDTHIDNLLAETGAKQVDLLGHSYGTMMSANYLNDPARSAKVAHYVNLDGFVTTEDGGTESQFNCEACYEITVPILAIWASMSGLEGRQVVDATENIMLMGTTHVQAASHAEAFYHMYKFFNNGRPPRTTNILPSSSEDIELAGKVIHFVTNLTPDNHTIELYEIDQDTGLRLSDTPLAEASVGDDGKFGPFPAKRDRHYEFYVYNKWLPIRTSLHFYYEPFVRSDYMIRLKTVPPFGLINTVIQQNRSENQSGLVIVRNKEFVGNAEALPVEQEMGNDSLTINGTQLCTAEITPAGSSTIGLFVYDFGDDGVDDLTQSQSFYSMVPFVGGVDLYMPASTVNPPDGIISIVVNARYKTKTSKKEQVINIPNWPSSTDRMVVQFNDWVQ
jgi:pimeloyl-ACP methyl ester carboxylesterase